MQLPFWARLLAGRSVTVSVSSESTSRSPCVHLLLCLHPLFTNFLADRLILVRTCRRSLRSSPFATTSPSFAGRAAITMTPNNRAPRQARTPSHDSTTLLEVAIYPYDQASGPTRRRPTLLCPDGRGAFVIPCSCGWGRAGALGTGRLTRWATTDRLLGFGACLIGAAVCFFVAFITIPMIALRPAKFALAFRCVFLCLPPRHNGRLLNYWDDIQFGESTCNVWVSELPSTPRSGCSTGVFADSQSSSDP